MVSLPTVVPLRQGQLEAGVGKKRKPQLYYTYPPITTLASCSTQDLISFLVFHFRFSVTGTSHRRATSEEPYPSCLLGSGGMRAGFLPASFINVNLWLKRSRQGCLPLMGPYLLYHQEQLPWERLEVNNQASLHQ